MLKQILIPALLIGACCVASFMPASKKQTTAATVTKSSPQSQISLMKAGVPLSGGGTSTVFITIDSLTNSILDVAMYSEVVPCQRYRVTGYSGGPIYFSGGAYRTFSPIIITFTGGTATVSGTFKPNAFSMCD